MDLGYSHTATVEHVVPRHSGGEKKKFNEVAACSKCNSLKGGMPIGDWLRRRMHERFKEAANDKGLQESRTLFCPPESPDPERGATGMQGQGLG